MIISDMANQGYTLTVRQLYYQFVARDLIPNDQKNYKNLASLIDNARSAGLVSWDAIEDRTRFLRRLPTYFDPENFIAKMAPQYAEDYWEMQPEYCEVWVEKDALVGIIERPCVKYRVPFFACRGYASSSSLYEASQRLEHIAQNRPVTIFHFGDHDPSGIDMTRANQDALDLFVQNADFEIRVERLALNMDQIEQYKPPPNPAKETDSRYEAYKLEHGEYCWELDALAPSVIDRLLTDAFDIMIDDELWEGAKQREIDNRQFMRKLQNRWGEVEELING